MKLIRSVMVLAALLVPALTQAQNPNARFAFTMEATPAATCQAYRFDLELDGVVAPAPLVVTCTAAGANSEVRAAIPAVTPGDHIARVRAVDITSPPFSPIFGPWSDPLNFTMKALPAKPGGLRIEPIPGGGN